MTNRNLVVLAVAAVALGGAALYLNGSSRPAGVGRATMNCWKKRL